MNSRLILFTLLVCTFFACTNNTEEASTTTETEEKKELAETQEDEPGEPSCDFRPRIVAYQDWLPTEPVDGVYLPRYIKIPAADIISLSEQTEDNIYAFFALEEENGNKYVDIVFGVQKEDNKFLYYDFTNPCPTSCELGTEVPECADPNTITQTTPTGEPGEPSCDFRTRIVAYADWLPSEPIDSVTLTQYVKIPAADIVSLAEQTEDNIYAFLGLLEEEGNKYVDIIFGVQKEDDKFLYYDFTNPCPTSCELGRETPACFE